MTNKEAIKYAKELLNSEGVDAVEVMVNETGKRKAYCLDVTYNDGTSTILYSLPRESVDAAAADAYYAAIAGYKE